MTLYGEKSLGLNYHYLAWENGASGCQIIQPEELREIHPMFSGDNVRRISSPHRVGFRIIQL
jgi:hypothetical protein